MGRKFGMVPWLIFVLVRVVEAREWGREKVRLKSFSNKLELTTGIPICHAGFTR